MQIPADYNLYLDGIKIPYSNNAKYLGMTLDTKLRWKEHIKKKRIELDIRLSKLYWLLGRKSKLSVYNKLLFYNQVLKPVWTYGIQLWGCTCKNNISIIQRFQNRALRIITNCPWYVRDADLHRDTGIQPVADVIQQFADAHNLRLSSHVNDEAFKLFNRPTTSRRLKRKLPQDLVSRNN